MQKFFGSKIESLGTYLSYVSSMSSMVFLAPMRLISHKYARIVVETAPYLC